MRPIQSRELDPLCTPATPRMSGFTPHNSHMTLWKPHCRPVPPAIFAGPVILTDLRSGSHLHLGPGWFRQNITSPDFRSDER